MKKNHPYSFPIKLFFPAIITVVLFIISFFWVIIPSFERNMMNGKRETIYELTQTACSILKKYNNEVEAGTMQLLDAQTKAAEEISSLRYGVENKDYFWITDKQPRMIRHPYRPELNNQDLSTFEDRKGKKIFVEFVNVVKLNQEGYVDYMWQWKDDSTRIVPKLSYVKEFKPWGWIVGTGIYIEDVKTEISKLEQRLFVVSIIITLLVVFFLTFIMRLSLKENYLKLQAEKELKLSRDRYKALAEASTEGTVMIIDNYVYANKSFLNMTGYDKEDITYDMAFDLLNIENLFDCNRNDFTACSSVFATPQKIETFILHKEGAKINVLINASVATLMEKEAIILIIRPTELLADDIDKNVFFDIASSLNMGTFTSTFSRKSRLVKCNDYMAKLLGADSKEELMGKNIDSFFADHAERQYFLKTLLSEQKITDFVVRVLLPNNDTFHASISASIRIDIDTAEAFCTGVIHNVSHLFDKLQLSETMMEEMNGAGIYLQQSVSAFVHPLQMCMQYDPVVKVAKMMLEQQMEIILVTTEQGDFAGYLKLQDLLKPFYDDDETIEKPVLTIMRAPIPSIKNNASLFDALVLSETLQIRQIPVKANSHSFSGIVKLDQLSILPAIYPAALITAIESESEIDKITLLHDKFRSVICSMLKSGLSSYQSTNLMSRFSDTVIQRLIKLAIEQLGPPPVDFVFVNLGSVGRGEQTFATDQDNAIIYADSDKADVALTKEYFLALGTKVSQWMDQIGYGFCKGNMMASNPKWCMPLLVWKKYFSEWLNKSEPQSLLEISVFFDFHSVFGNNEIADELRNYISIASANKGAFYFNLSQSIMMYKPPINRLGGLVTDGSGPNEFLDIKNAMAPLTMMIRLYSIFHGISETNTIERLHLLLAKNVFTKAFVKEFEYNYQYLMSLRLQHQARNMVLNVDPDNHINPKELSEMEQLILRKIFGHYSAYQAKINYTFNGNLA